MASFFLFSVNYSVPKVNLNVGHRHEGGEAGQDFGFPIGAKRLEFEVSLQPETQGHHDMLTCHRGARTPACRVESRLDASVPWAAGVGMSADAARRSACATTALGWP